MTNKERADWGAAAVRNGTPDFEHNDEVDNITDSLANIMHYCRLNDLGFTNCLSIAEQHFESEFCSECDDDAIDGVCEKCSAKQELDEQGPPTDRFIELGNIILKEAGEASCLAGYGTTDPEWVGRYALMHSDINLDGTLN